MVRGSKDFKTLTEYEQWLHHVVENSNRRNSKGFKLEQSALRCLPTHKTADVTIQQNNCIFFLTWFLVKNCIFPAKLYLV